MCIGAELCCSEIADNAVPMPGRTTGRKSVVRGGCKLFACLAGTRRSCLPTKACHLPPLCFAPEPSGISDQSSKLAAALRCEADAKCVLVWPALAGPEAEWTKDNENTLYKFMYPTSGVKNIGQSQQFSSRCFPRYWFLFTNEAVAIVAWCGLCQVRAAVLMCVSYVLCRLMSCGACVYLSVCAATALAVSGFGDSLPSCCGYFHWGDPAAVSGLPFHWCCATAPPFLFSHECLRLKRLPYRPLVAAVVIFFYYLLLLLVIKIITEIAVPFLPTSSLEAQLKDITEKREAMRVQVFGRRLPKLHVGVWCAVRACDF